MHICAYVYKLLKMAEKEKSNSINLSKFLNSAPKFVTLLKFV